MRALVTGGTLVRALVAGGAQVRVLARPTSQTEAAAEVATLKNGVQVRVSRSRTDQIRHLIV